MKEENLGPKIYKRSRYMRISKHGVRVEYILIDEQRYPG